MPKELKNQLIKGIAGKPMKIPDPNYSIKDEKAVASGEEEVPIIEAKVSDAIRIFIFNLPAGKLKLKDTSQAAALYAQITSKHADKPEDILVINNDEYDWLQKMWEDYATNIFGINTAYIWDNFFKPVQ